LRMDHVGDDATDSKGHQHHDKKDHYPSRNQRLTVPQCCGVARRSALRGQLYESCKVAHRNPRRLSARLRA
jgi:hypothetical protein